jgi:putative hydrolase of the HAD superfamily
MLIESIDALIFDLDNTLIDRNAALRSGLQGFLKSLGFYEPERQAVLEDIMQYDNRGYTDRMELCSWFLHKYGKGEIGKLKPEYFFKAFQLLILQNLQPDAQVQAALQSLAIQFQIVLATNGSGDTQRQKLALAELESFFQPEAIFISGEMGCEKPDPQFYNNIIHTLQLNTERTMMIGDNLYHDIQAANAFGLYTCWVSHGREGEAGIQPHHIIKNITEISTWSKQLI